MFHVAVFWDELLLRSRPLLKETPMDSAPETALYPSLDVLDSPVFLKAIVDSMVDGIFVFDRDFRCLFSNSAMERIAGASGSQVVGKNLFEVFPFLEETGEDQ